jgi:predicted HicB family RNase H-like nuclease
MNEIDKFTYVVSWAPDDECYVAYCMEFPSAKTHGDTVEEAQNELRFLLAEVLKDFKAKGKEIPEALCERNFKGNISLRVSSDTHRELIMSAAMQDVSLNQWITTLIEKNMQTSTLVETIRDLKSSNEQLRSELDRMQIVTEQILEAYFLMSSRNSVSQNYQGSLGAYVEPSDSWSAEPQNKQVEL